MTTWQRFRIALADTVILMALVVLGVSFLGRCGGWQGYEIVPLIEEAWPIMLMGFALFLMIAFAREKGTE